MNFRFLTTLTLFAFVLAVTASLQTVLGALEERSFSKDSQPNVVLIIADDEDYEHFGFMGNEPVRTPKLMRRPRLCMRCATAK